MLSMCHVNDLLASLCADARGLQFKQPLGPRQNSRLVIFDENKEHPEPQELKLESWAAPPVAKAKENEQKPDKWTNAKVRCIAFVFKFWRHLTSSFHFKCRDMYSRIYTALWWSYDFLNTFSLFTSCRRSPGLAIVSSCRRQSQISSPLLKSVISLLWCECSL